MKGYTKAFARKGFSLITTAIVLVLASAAATTYFIQSQNKELLSQQGSADNDDNIKLTFIDSKIAALPNIPCPADPRALKNSPTYLTAAGTAPNCSTNLPRNGTTHFKGVVPTRTLGISDNYAFDKYKNFISYSMAVPPYPTNKFQVETTGTCISKTGTASGCSFVSYGGNDPNYVLVAHGKTGVGAFKKNLTTAQSQAAFSQAVHQIPAPVVNGKSFDSLAQAANSDLYLSGVGVDQYISRPAAPPGTPTSSGGTGNNIMYDNVVLTKKGTLTAGVSWQISWDDCSAPEPSWTPSDTETGWGTCSGGMQSRTVTCISRGSQTSRVTCSTGTRQNCVDAGLTEPAVETRECVKTECSGTKPLTSRACNSTYTTGEWGACSAAAPTWQSGAWSACNPVCGDGTQTRTVSCPATSGTRTRSVTCPGGGCSGAVPPSSETCYNTSACSGSAPQTWQSCSASCGGEGFISCWKNGAFYSDPELPPNLNGVDKIKGLSRNVMGTCAIRATDSVVQCWGNNNWGQMNVPANTVAKDVSIGYRGGCAIKSSDSTLVCWGSSNIPSIPGTLGAVKKVVVVADSACAIKSSNNAVVCWGDTSGRGENTVPAALDAASDLSGKTYHLCASRLSDGKAYCWGTNGAGEVGGTPNLTGVKAVSAGINVSCALKSDNTLQCWGNQPTPYAGTVKAMTSGDNSTCAIKSDDTITCWGYVADPIYLPGGFGTAYSISVASTGCAIKK